MSPQTASTTDQRTVSVVALDWCQQLGTLLVGGVAIAILSLWHRLVGPDTHASPPTNSDDGDPAVVEYELDWIGYIKAFDAHHGPGGGPDRSIAWGSFARGLRLWVTTRFLRGYTLDDSVYVCPNAPEVLRVHQAGHTPSFGGEFPTLVRPRRANGGLEDAPLWTLDVMLPGDFPHTLLRWRDSRGLVDAYREWLHNGRLQRYRRS